LGIEANRQPIVYMKAIEPVWNERNAVRGKAAGCIYFPQLQAPSAQPQVAQLNEADPQPGMMIEVYSKDRSCL